MNFKYSIFQKIEIPRNPKAHGALIISLVFSFFMMLGGLPKLGHALDWNDKAWEEFGCPKNVLGTWVSENDDKRLIFDNKRMVSRSGEGDENLYALKGNLQASENRFIKITVNRMDSAEEKPVYMKIRPHLVLSKNKSIAPDCLIKVFRFKSRKDAQLEKYMSWDIYKKVNGDT
jgi:hypothetical protein